MGHPPPSVACEPSPIPPTARSKAKENRSLAEKLEAARETWTVLGSFTSFRMTLSTRGGYLYHRAAFASLCVAMSQRLGAEPLLQEFNTNPNLRRFVQSQGIDCGNIRLLLIVREHPDQKPIPQTGAHVPCGAKNDPMSGNTPLMNNFTVVAR